MADKRISQLVERVTLANNDVFPIVASGATTTNKVTLQTIDDYMQTNLNFGVTSVAMSVPTGLSVAGSPITSTGTFVVTFTAGYSIPTNAKQTEWDTAYNLRITSATAPLGIASNVISITQSGASSNGYLSSTDWNTFNNKQNALTFGNLTEDTSSVLTITGGTGSVIGSGTTIQVKQATSSQDGFLDSADWTIFNNKQNALSGTGIVKSTGGTITYLTDNTSNWDSAYNDKINSASVTGTTTKTLTLNQQDGGTITTTWTDLDTGTVTSVGVSMPSAFSVANSPITSSGTIAITGAGTINQYIDGTGALQTFPSIISQATNLVTEVYNNSGATLSKGTVVYITGGQGNLPTISKALATGDATSAQTYGVVQNDITNMNNGYVVVAGRLSDLDTQAYANGTQLYLSSTTAGAWTSTKQYAPDHLVYIGIVVRSHPTQGVVEVKIQNGYEMDEIHDVSAQNPNNNDILQYKTATGLWTKTAGTTSNIAEGSNLYYTDARSRAAISESVTGLDYNSSTGVLSTTTGYAIPTTASQTNWDAAYNDKINSAAVSGTTTKTLTLTQQDGGTITASWTDINTDAVSSVFGRTGAVVAVSGDYNTDQVTEGSSNLYFTNARSRSSITLTTTGTSGAATYNSTTGVLNIPSYVGGVTSVNTLTGAVVLTTSNIAEGTNLYYTDTRARAAISLTTTGSSGAATYSAGVLNVPNYTLSGLGGVPTTRTLTINGTAFDLSADRSWTVTAGVTGSGTNDYLTKWSGGGTSITNSTLYDNGSRVDFLGAGTSINGGWTVNQMNRSIYPVIAFNSTATPNRYAGIGYEAGATSGLYFWVNSSDLNGITVSTNRALFLGNDKSVSIFGALSGTSAIFSSTLTASYYDGEVFRVYTSSTFRGGIGTGSWAFGDGTTDMALYSQAAVKIGAGGVERMRITNAGNFDYGGFNVQSSNNSVYRQAFWGALSILWRNAEDVYLNSNHTYGSSNTNVATYTSANGMGRLQMAGGEFEWYTYNGSVTAGTAYTMVSACRITKAGEVISAGSITSGNTFLVGAGGQGGGVWTWGANDSYIYSPATKHLHLSSGSNGATNGIHIATSGNVTIGGTEASQKLRVNGSLFSTFNIVQSASATGEIGYFRGSNFGAAYGTNSDGAYFLSSYWVTGADSNISFQTTTSAGAQDTRMKLEYVAMSGGWRRVLTLKATYPVLAFHSTDGNKYGGIGYDASGGGNMVFKGGATSTDLMTGQTLAAVGNDGQWTYGTGSASWKLFINETSNKGGENGILIRSGYYPAIRFEGINGVASNAKIVINTFATGYGASSLAGSFLLQADNAMQFSTGGDNVRMTITSAGRVGIGSTTSNYSLYANGSICAGYVLLGDTGNGANSTIEGLNGNGNTTYGNLHIQYYGSGYLSLNNGGGNCYIGNLATADDYNYKLSVAGTIHATGDVIAYSDISVKKNIRPIENVLERVTNSRGVVYDRVDNDDKNNIGFIAQELEKQFPELVNTNANGTKGVKYQNAVAILFEAVKEQQKQIEELKKQVA
jgi:hypothetical protein